MQNWPAHSLIAYTLELHDLTSTGFKKDMKPFVVGDIGTGNAAFLLGLTSRLTKHFGEGGFRNVQFHASDFTLESKRIIEQHVKSKLLPQSTKFHNSDIRTMKIPLRTLDFAAVDYVLPYISHKEALEFVRQQLSPGITETGAVSIRLLTTKGDRYKYISTRWEEVGKNEFKDPKTRSVLSFYDDVQIQDLIDIVPQKLVYWAKGLHRTNSYYLNCDLGTHSLIFSNHPELEALKPSVPPYAGYALQRGFHPDTAYIINDGRWDTRAALMRGTFPGIVLKHKSPQDIFLGGELNDEAAAMIVASISNFSGGTFYKYLTQVIKANPNLLSERISALSTPGSFISWNCNFLENGSKTVPKSLFLNPKVIGGDSLLRARGKYLLGPHKYSFCRQVFEVKQQRAYSTSARIRVPVSGCHIYPNVFSTNELEENYQLIQGFFKQKAESAQTYNGYTKRSYSKVEIPDADGGIVAKLFRNYSQGASNSRHDLLYFEKNQCPAELRPLVNKVLTHPELLKDHPEGVASFKLTINQYGPNAEFRFHKDLVSNGAETWIIPINNKGIVSEMVFVDAQKEKDGPLSDATIKRLITERSLTTIPRKPGNIIRLDEGNLRTYAHSVQSVSSFGGASIAIGISFNESAA